jgi:hypothetical protein
MGTTFAETEMDKVLKEVASESNRQKKNILK